MFSLARDQRKSLLADLFCYDEAGADCERTGESEYKADVLVR